MSGRSVCIVFNNVDDTSGIGTLCAWSARTALAAGWRVSVVARDLAPDLRSEVEWLPLYVPPRLHVVQWYAALPTVHRAIGSRRWDVLHASQPQLVPIADVLHLHYLVRAAREHSGPTAVHGLRQRMGPAQARLTELGEDRRLCRLPDRLTLMPVSRFLAAEFVRLYGVHARTTVLDSPAPEHVRPLDEKERRAARTAAVGQRDGLVLGFLGGADPRKGGRALLDAVAGTDGVTVLYGGSGVPDHPVAADPRRVVRAGYVTDLSRFLGACDALVVPSTWDPGPLTALEAAAAGVPVIGTMTCGIVRDLVAEGAALPWQHGTPLAGPLGLLRSQGRELGAAGVRVAGQRSRRQQGERLLEVFEAAAGGAADAG